MSGFDWLVVIVMAVIGWWVVSFLLNRSKPQDEAGEGSRDADHARTGVADADFPTAARLPAPGNSGTSSDASRSDGPGTASPSMAAPPSVDINDRADLLSLEEIGRAWSSILGVASDASGAQIEAAYHAKLAECDRVRFDANASPSSRRAAEQQRARVNQAYEFIRPARS